MKQSLTNSVFAFLFLFLFVGNTNHAEAQCLPRPNGIAIDTINGLVYWSDMAIDAIFVGNIDGTGSPSILYDDTDVFYPRDVAIDVTNGYIYWAELDPFGPPFYIIKANLDGSGGVTVLYDDSDGVDGPNGIAVDPDNDRLFWGEVFGQNVVEGHVDGSGTAAPTVLYDNAVDGVEGARGIALDIPNGKMYWADFDGSNDYGRIFEGEMDGTGSSVLFDLGDFYYPHSVAIDPANGLIYWTDIFFDEIWVGNLDGSGTPTILYDFTDGIFGPTHIDIDVTNGKLYWVEMFDGQIVSANADGSGTATPLFYKTFDGGGDGQQWSDPLNWSGDVVPTAMDHVFIPANEDVFVSTSGEEAMEIIIGNSGSLTLQNGSDLMMDNYYCGNAITLMEGASLGVFGTLTIYSAGDDAIDMTKTCSLLIGGAGHLIIDDAADDAIDLEGASMTNHGTIDINYISENGMCFNILDGMPSSGTNFGTINIDTLMSSDFGNAISLFASTFTNSGDININHTHNDGIRMDSLFSTISMFTNKFNASIDLNDIGDDGIDVNSGNSFLNEGSITMDSVGDHGFSISEGSTVTNNYIITMTDVDQGIFIDEGVFNNNMTINIGLDVASVAPAIRVGSTFTNGACGVLNFTSDNDLLIVPTGIFDNQGIVTSVATNHTNNGIFNNSGEVRPAAFPLTGNAIVGNAPVDGTIPATMPLDPVACAALAPMAAVPTLSQWGLILLALTFMVLGTVMSMAYDQPLAGTGNGVPYSFNLNSFPFERNAYLQIWVRTALSIAVFFVLAVVLFGYEITSADPLGAMVSSFLAAYLVFLFAAKR